MPATPTSRATTQRRAHDQAQEAHQHEGLRESSRKAEGRDPYLRLGEAVEEDGAGSDGDHDDVGRQPARLQQARPEGSPAHGPVLVGDRGKRRHAAEEREPDAEDLAVLEPGRRPYWAIIARVRTRVAEDDEGQGPRAGAGCHELEPDDGREADDGRPLAEDGRDTRQGRCRRRRPRAAPGRRSRRGWRTGPATARWGRRRPRRGPPRPSRRPR